MTWRPTVTGAANRNHGAAASSSSTEAKPATASRQSNTGSAERHQPRGPRESLLLFRGQAISRLLPILLGLMTLLAVFFALQSMQRLLVIHRALLVAQSALTVIVPTTPGLSDPAGDPALSATLDVLEGTVGLTRIRSLDEEETRRLIGDSLDAGLNAQVPLPAVITLRRTARAVVSTEGLRQALNQAAPGTILYDNASLRQKLRQQQLTELTSTAALLLVVLLAVAGTTVLTISQTMDLQAPVIEVLLMSGAQDRLVIQHMTRFIARMAILGAAPGALVGFALHLGLTQWLLSSGNQALFPVLLPLMALVTASVLVLIVLLALLTTAWRVTGKLHQTF